MILIVNFVSCGKEANSNKPDQIQSAVISLETSLTSIELAALPVLDLNPITDQPMRPYIEWYTTYPDRV